MVTTALIAMTFILIRIANQYTGQIMDYRVLIATCFLPVTSLLVLLVLLEYAELIPANGISSIALVISAVALLLVNTLVLWLFQHMSKQSERVLQLSGETQRMSLQLRHQAEVEQLHIELRQWKHDHHNHMQLLLGLLGAGQQKEAMDYLRRLSDTFESFTAKITTGNLMMDALLNAKAPMAQYNHIAFMVDVALPPVLSIADNDLCVLVGNLLDNAFDACMRIPEEQRRYIKICGNIRNSSLSIYVENSMRSGKRWPGVFSLTSKAENMEHGFGLRVIEKLVGQYGGFIESKDEETRFTTSLLLPLRLEGSK
jgi:sensor histidine kinase regulating citrate/malate metabolism